MKLSLIICLLFLAVSCSNEPKKEQPKKVETENLIEYKDGIYTEYYPGRKKIKIQGARDKKKVRDGKWVLLSDKGEQMSVTFFEKGKRTGIAFVKHPNGTINYTGEYKDDQQVGIWKFHNDQGKLIKTEDHDQTPVKITLYK